MLELVHYLHIVSGVVWAGSVLAMALIVMPAMRTLEPSARAAFTAAVERHAGPVMGAAGGLVMLTGVARAILGGGIQSLGDVFGPYGLWVLAALVIVGALGGGTRPGRRAAASAAGDGGDPQPAATGGIPIAVVLRVGGVLAVLAIMVVLGMGLY